MSGLQSGEDLVQVAAGLLGGQTAQAVIAAEFNDDNFGVHSNDGTEIGDSVLGGCAAGALVVDLVMVAERVEFLLQIIGIGLAGLEAVAGGDAVAEANQQGAIRGLDRASEGRGGEQE